MSRLLPPVLVIAAAASLAAQTPPVARSRPNDVRLELYAARDDEVVEDLRSDEIVLLEDGAPQTIDSFERVVVGPAGSRQSRMFVVFIDTLHAQFEGSTARRVALARLLDRVIGQDDLVAVMTPDTEAAGLAFGPKGTVISDLMQAEWTGGRAQNTHGSKEALYSACYPDKGDTAGLAAEMTARRRERQTLDAMGSLVAHLRGLRDERKAVLTVTEGWTLHGPDRRLAGAIGAARAQRECEADGAALAMLDHTQRLRALAEEANRGTVSFYTVSAQALAATGRRQIDARQDGLRQLAADTDAVAILDPGQVDAALRRIAADLSSYYLLGYVSTNTRLDGRFRSIIVRVKRPGVQVRTRRGYRGFTAERLLTATEGDTGAADANALRVAVNPRAPFRIRTATWTRPGAGASVWVVGELDYATRKELAWSAGAIAEVVVLSADGAEVLTTTVPVSAGEGTFTLALPGAVPPGEYALRVRVRPESSPGLPVTDTARLTIPATAAALGDAVMWRRGPSTGMKYLATADPRFQRSERIRIEMATAMPGTPAARMLDRAGNPLRVPVQASERSDPSDGVRWIVAEAALAPLAAGDYAIEVTLGGVRQVAPFKIVP